MKLDLVIAKTFMGAMSTPFRAKQDENGGPGWEVHSVMFNEPPVIMMEGLSRNDAYMVLSAAQMVYFLKRTPAIANKDDWHLVSTLLFDVDADANLIAAFIDRHDLIERGPEFIVL